MVEKPVKLSSKNTKPVGITSQALASRNLKACGKKGALPSDGDIAEYLSDAEAARYLNNTKEFLLNKMAWEMMNPDYGKRKQRKPTTVKKKDPINKKTSATKTKSNTESENKKRPSADINYDLLDELFNDENSPKKTKLDKADVVGDQMVDLQQSSEGCLLKPLGSEVEDEEKEEEEADSNENNSNEDAYGGVEEFYGIADLEYEEDQDEVEDNEEINWRSHYFVK